MYKEQEQLLRLQSMVKDLDRLVWSKNAFPQEHRPEVDFLINNIEINSNPPLFLQPHPLLAQLRDTPTLDMLVKQGTATSSADNEINTQKKIAEYNPLTRVICLSEGAMTTSDRSIKRYIAHEMATDSYGKAVAIPPDEFSEYTKEQIRLTFEQLKDLGIDIKGEMEILKSGSLQHLLVDQHIVATFGGEAAEIYDEIYPTMFELITLAVADRNGDYRKVEKDIKQGNLRVSNDEQHPRFAETFYKACEIVDWRKLLTIFKNSNFKEALAQLNNQSSFGDGIFVRLIRDMQQDEENIVNGVGLLNKLGINNRTGTGKGK